MSSEPDPTDASSPWRLLHQETGRALCPALAEDAPWFQGHFPGEPVLPGVAQLALVEEALEEDGLEVTAFRAVRFRRPVGPGVQLELSWDSQTGEEWAFTLSDAHGPVTTGWARRSSRRESPGC